MAPRGRPPRSSQATVSQLKSTIQSQPTKRKARGVGLAPTTQRQQRASCVLEPSHDHGLRSTPTRRSSNQQSGSVQPDQLGKGINKTVAGVVSQDKETEDQEGTNDTIDGNCEDGNFTVNIGSSQVDKAQTKPAAKKKRRGQGLARTQQKSSTVACNLDVSGNLGAQSTSATGVGEPYGKVQHDPQLSKFGAALVSPDSETEDDQEANNDSIQDTCEDSNVPPNVGKLSCPNSAVPDATLRAPTCSRILRSTSSNLARSNVIGVGNYVAGLDTPGLGEEFHDSQSQGLPVENNDILSEDWDPVRLPTETEDLESRDPTLAAYVRYRRSYGFTTEQENFNPDEFRFVRSQRTASNVRGRARSSQVSSVAREGLILPPNPDSNFLDIRRRTSRLVRTPPSSCGQGSGNREHCSEQVRVGDHSGDGVGMEEPITIAGVACHGSQRLGGCPSLNVQSAGLFNVGLQGTTPITPSTFQEHMVQTTTPTVNNTSHGVLNTTPEIGGSSLPHESSRVPGAHSHVSQRRRRSLEVHPSPGIFGEPQDHSRSNPSQGQESENVARRRKQRPRTVLASSNGASRQQGNRKRPSTNSAQETRASMERRTEQGDRVGINIPDSQVNDRSAPSYDPLPFGKHSYPRGKKIGEMNEEQKKAKRLADCLRKRAQRARAHETANGGASSNRREGSISLIKRPKLTLFDGLPTGHSHVRVVRELSLICRREILCFTKAGELKKEQLDRVSKMLRDKYENGSALDPEFIKFRTSKLVLYRRTRSRKKVRVRESNPATNTQNAGPPPGMFEAEEKYFKAELADPKFQDRSKKFKDMAKKVKKRNNFGYGGVGRVRAHYIMNNNRTPSIAEVEAWKASRSEAYSQKQGQSATNAENEEGLGNETWEEHAATDEEVEIGGLHGPSSSRSVPLEDMGPDWDHPFRGPQAFHERYVLLFGKEPDDTELGAWLASGRPPLYPPEA